MILLVKMAVDCQPVWSSHIVPVLIDTFVGSLRFDFADILFSIAFHAKGKVKGVLRVAVCAMPNFVSGLAVSVGKERSVYQMVAAKAVAPSHAGAASAPVGRFFAYNSALDESGLTDFIPKTSIFLVAQDGFV